MAAIAAACAWWPAPASVTVNYHAACARWAGLVRRIVLCAPVETMAREARRSRVVRPKGGCALFVEADLGMLAQFERLVCEGLGDLIDQLDGALVYLLAVGTVAGIALGLQPRLHIAQQRAGLGDE